MRLELRNKITQTFLIILLSFASLKASPYELGKGDYWATGIGALAGGAGLYMYGNIDAPTQQEIASLKRSDIIGFDRGTTKNWNLDRANESDFTVFVSMALPATLFFTETARDDFREISVMYMETMLLTNALATITKSVVKRYRPYCYDNKAPYSEKYEPFARTSFFSSHSANAFAGAVFLGSVYGEYFPDSKFKGIVWSGALLTAGYTAYLRVAAGKHFPTDVIAGAIVGGAIGYLVPHLHKKEPQPLDIPLNYTVSPVRVTLTYKF